MKREAPFDILQSQSSLIRKGRVKALYYLTRFAFIKLMIEEDSLQNPSGYQAYQWVHNRHS